MRAALFLLLAPLAVGAQPFTAGIKAGVPLTDFISGLENRTFTRYISQTHRYLLGGTAELRLPFSLAVEFDAIYRRVGYTAIAAQTYSTAANAWEFPLLLKYRLHAPLVRPYVDGGVAWDTLQGLAGSLAASGVKHTTITGIVLGAGVDIHAVFLHISPEVRYTRWTSPHITSPYGMVTSNQNQAEFMVGFTF
jgi:hypothetical protein